MKNSASKSEAPVSLFYYDNYKSQSYNQNDRLPITSQTLADAGPVRPDHAACQYQPDGIFSLCATSGWNGYHANCAATALQMGFPKAKDWVIFLLVVQWGMSSSLIYEWL